MSADSPVAQLKNRTFGFHPPRPMVPATAYVLVIAWVVVWLCATAWWSAWSDGRHVPVAVVGGLVVAVLCLLIIRSRQVRAVALIIIATLLITSLWCNRWYAGALPHSGTVTSGEFIVRVEDDPYSARYARYTRVRIERYSGGVSGNPSDSDASGIPRRLVEGMYCTLQSGDEVDIGPGQRVVLRGVLRPPEFDEWGSRDFRTGSIGTLSVTSLSDCQFPRDVGGGLGRIRAGIQEILDESKADRYGLVAGLLIADRTALRGSTLEESFRACGLSHLLAISGTHLMLVASAIGSAVDRSPFSARGRTVIVLATLTVFTLLTGASASTVRALLMSGSTRVAPLFARRGSPLAALSICAVVMLFISPTHAFDLGFALSVLSVGGIVVLSPLVRSWLRPLAPRMLSGLADSVALTVSAQIATAPVVICTFNTVSLISPFANAVIAPLVVWVMSLGFVGVLASGIARPVGALALTLAGWIGDVISLLSGHLARLPLASILASADPFIASACTVAILAALWVSWPRLSAGVARTGLICGVVALVVAVTLPQNVGSSKIVMLDVGQAQSVLIQSNGNAVLVDVGGSPSTLRKALSRHRVTHLEAVILTHLHDDHIGGLKGLSHAVDVGAVYVPVGTLSDPQEASESVLGDIRDVGGESIHTAELQAGDRIEFGDLTLDVVWPVPPVSDPSANESSICVLVRTEELSALIVGDAESEVLETAMSRVAPFQVDAFAVGHHGSADSVSFDLLRIIRPRAALVSAGVGNDYGHPASSTLDLLKQHGIEIYRTDVDGDITVRFTRGTVRVSTLRD